MQNVQHAMERRKSDERRSRFTNLRKPPYLTPGGWVYVDRRSGDRRAAN